jgi:lauroyl/myristoyl acyltransferase
VRWLKSPHHVLTVALDVREPAANKPEQAFQFMGQTIYLQTGPARLAQMTGARMVPAAIEYNPQTQCHSLSLYPALNPPEWTAQELTQKALDDIGPHIARSPQQQFYDLLGALQMPQAA